MCNLRIDGAKETSYETWKKCEKHLKTLFKDRLGTEKNVTIERAHRTKSIGRRSKPRTIFLSFIIIRTKLRSCKMQRKQRGPISLLMKILVRKP